MLTSNLPGMYKLSENAGTVDDLNKPNIMDINHSYSSPVDSIRTSYGGHLQHPAGDLYNQRASIGYTFPQFNTCNPPIPFTQMNHYHVPVTGREGNYLVYFSVNNQRFVFELNP